jgi:hypothetical protein
MAKLGIVFGSGFNSKLTKFFTGSRAYHVFWVTEEYVYDMWLLRRRRPFWTYCNAETMFHDFPDVTQAYLEKQLTEDTSEYGFVDYILFALRPIYHLFGKSTRNANGQICSEMCNNDLIACGYATPWWDKKLGPPSPADFERWFKGSIVNKQ